MEQQQYWDSVSQTKQFTTPFQADAFCAYVKKDAAVLDVGCGYGRTLDELHQQGFQHLIGIDFAQGMIERGRKQFPYLDLRVKRNASLEFEDHSIDAVILFAVLTCIRDDDEQRDLVREISRVLKPGGILYVNDFLLNTDERNVNRYQKYESVFGNYGVFELPEGAVCRHHKEEWIMTLLENFDPLKYERLTFTTMNGHTSNGFFFIGKSNAYL